MDVFLGSIMTFGFNYAPYGWANCNGQTMQVSQYSALFALLGTYYGGNGTSTFVLPDLRGRSPISQGQGPGQGVSLTNRIIGENGGTENVLLTISNIPTHTLPITSTLAVNTSISLTTVQTDPKVAPTTTNSFVGASNPTGPGSANMFSSAIGADPVNQQGVNSSLTGTVTAGSIGGGLPFSAMNPFLVVNFSIALQGIFPSRN